MNKVIVTGRLGRDVELSTAPQSGKSVTTITLAVQDRFNREQTDWFDVVLWDKLAELAGQYLRKGSKILVEGRLKTRSWDNKEGQKVYKTEIIAENIEFLDSKSDSNQQGQSQGQSQQQSSPFASNEQVMDLSDDNLPF